MLEEEVSVLDSVQAELGLVEGIDKDRDLAEAELCLSELQSGCISLILGVRLDQLGCTLEQVVDHLWVPHLSSALSDQDLREQDDLLLWEQEELLRLRLSLHLELAEAHGKRLSQAELELIPEFDAAELGGACSARGLEVSDRLDELLQLDIRQQVAIVCQDEIDGELVEELLLVGRVEARQHLDDHDLVLPHELMVKGVAAVPDKLLEELDVSGHESGELDVDDVLDRGELTPASPLLELGDRFLQAADFANQLCLWVLHRHHRQLQ